MGIWSPLNILVSLGWGAFLFGEFTATAPVSALFTSLAVLALIGGLLTVIRAGGAAGGGASASTRGQLFAIGAGPLWGSYFLPIRWSGVPAASAVLPMAAGMFGAACILVLATRAPVRLAVGTDYLRLPLSGLMWSAGNFGSLALMEQVGTGRGFSIAQFCLVVNALAGIFLLKMPAPGSPVALRVLAGCSLATIGGVVLGLSR
jgi:glucose uptake protein